MPMKRLLTLSAFALLTTACGTLKPVKDTSVSHLLDPLLPERRVTRSTPIVAIARPALPSYLDRQQLVSRKTNGEMEMNSYHLWAEPLDAGISRVMSQNLARLTGSLNIQPIESFITMEYDRTLEIRVMRFEPDVAGNLVFRCTWKLQPVSGVVTTPRPFEAVIPIQGPSDPAGPQSGRIHAMNEALAALARTVARSL